MARELFGTDGIRGVAGEFPLDPRTVFAFGAALGKWAARHGQDPQVVVGMDTRESGPWLAEQVAGGLAEAGAKAHFAGVITTPGIAWATRTGPYVAGVVISASHNPYEDNGLKVFGHSGYKLPDAEEEEVEEEIRRLVASGLEPHPRPMDVESRFVEGYLDYLASTSQPLDGMTVTVDCGHGASSGLAPKLFERMGARVNAVGCSPNGRNINLGTGSLHLDFLRKHVLEQGADAGVAFDGDADRALFVARSGKIVDGDAIMLVCGRALLEKGKLAGSDGAPLVVATVMSNLGLEKALEACGIRMLRTPVGDKYVLEEMLRREAALGGEQSGHVIFREYATTGDGLLTALQVLSIMRAAGQGLDELTETFKVFPQKLVNVRVKQKRPIEELPTVQREIAAAKASFGGAGRVVVRYSGTEPLARVMIEAPEQAQVDEFCERIAEAIQSDLGAG